MSGSEKFDLILNKLNELSIDMRGVKEDVSGLKQDVSGLKQDVSELKQDVSGLKQDVSVLKQDMSELKEKVLELEKMDAMILDEVVRVHDIMIKRTDDIYLKIGYPKAVYK